MKKKLVLRPWVKAVLLLLPEMIIIGQLFFVGHKLNQLTEIEKETKVVVEMRCYND